MTPLIERVSQERLRLAREHLEDRTAFSLQSIESLSRWDKNGRTILGLSGRISQITGDCGVVFKGPVRALTSKPYEIIEVPVGPNGTVTLNGSFLEPTVTRRNVHIHMAMQLQHEFETYIAEVIKDSDWTLRPLPARKHPALPLSPEAQTQWDAWIDAARRIVLEGARFSNVQA